MKIIVFALYCLNCAVVFGQPPAVLTTPASSLRLFKEDLSKNNPHALDLVKRLRTAADSLLTMQPVSVMDKAFTPESGDKHDYMSQAPYFWYDSSKPNGKPYLRRDGQRNPEIYKITDRTDLGRLADASRLLALAWYAAGDEKYARKATTLLETWFINDATRMHPNLDFGQAIPGVNSGRGIGIIETVSLLQITDAAVLLQGSAAWSSTHAAALKKWFAAYLNWLLTSKNGRDEHAAKNNHGTWYYAQAIDFALFTGDDSRASSLLRESEVRLDSQLSADGRQPLELERTNGLGYSSMDLRGWCTVATLAAVHGADLWQYTTSKGAGIKKAIDWLLPFVLGRQPWTYQQIGHYNAAAYFYPILLQAALVYKDPTYREAGGTFQKQGLELAASLVYYQR